MKSNNTMSYGKKYLQGGREKKEENVKEKGEKTNEKREIEVKWVK